MPVEICPAPDIDTYSFHHVVDGITVHAAPSPALDVKVVIERADGTPVATIDAKNAGIAEDKALLLPTGDYFAVVSSYASRTLGSYDLTLTSNTIDCTDTHEGGEALATPDAYATGYTGAICPAADAEFVRFDTAGGDVTVAAGADAYLDVVLEVFDSTGTLVAGGHIDDRYEGDPESRVLHSVPAGSYTVKVTSFRAASRGGYRLSVTTAPSGS